MLSILRFLELFAIGVIECFLSALNTKFLQKNKKLLCFIVSYISILIWWFVLRLMVNDINNVAIINIYAIGFALGDVLALMFDGYLDKIAKIKGYKVKRKRKVKGRIKK